jgi:hypothetical protein
MSGIGSYFPISKFLIANQSSAERISSSSETICINLFRAAIQIIVLLVLPNPRGFLFFLAANFEMQQLALVIFLFT